MTAISAGVPSLDRLVHEPARLAILSMLSGVDEVDFNYLLTALGLSRGNLSSHMTKLAEAGYVVVVKRFIGATPNTAYSITEAGRAALLGYWNKLYGIRQAAARSSSVAAPAPSTAENVGGGE